MDGLGVVAWPSCGLMIEVLHWVVERFERNGHSVEVGEALRVFPVASRDTIALAHTLAERSWMFPGCVVSTKRLPLSDLADSLAADSTTPSESRSMEVAVADARDIPKLSNR